MNRVQDVLAPLQQALGPNGAVLLLIGVAALVMVGLLLWALRRGGGAGDLNSYDAAGDRFAPAPPINEDQIEMLGYLQRAFPEGAVIFRPELKRFLTVRKSGDRARALRQLAHWRVDFLICAEDGRPLFAFEVDAFRDAGDESVQRSAAIKNFMLKTAGIRLIRLKGSLHSLPDAIDLRRRLLASARPAQQLRKEEFGASGFGPAVIAPSSFGESGFGPSGFKHGRPNSDVMGLSGLMGIQPPEGDDPWGGVRKR